MCPYRKKHNPYNETPYERIPMTKIELTKRLTSLIVGVGTGKIISSIIKNNVAPEKLTDKVAIACASYVLGAMVADAASNWTDAKIDEAVNWWNENVRGKKEPETEES